MGLHRNHVHCRRALSVRPLPASPMAAAVVRRHALRLYLSARPALRDRGDFQAHTLLAGEGLPFLTALLYAIGIAGVYLLMRVGTGSRGCAWLAAVSTALMSPIFLFMPRFRGDAWLLHPQRLGVLVKYGEGPHMSALALIPIALAF